MAARQSKGKTITIRPKAAALTIAGSDPSGGAGLQADLKTFQQLGVYGMSAVTLITVQNTLGVRQVEVLSPDLVLAQIEAVISDIPPLAIKLGALGNARVVQAVGEYLASIQCPIVVDPVLTSKHGHSLAADDVVEAYRRYVLPHAWMVTPNRFEAERLAGMKLSSEDDVSQAIDKIHAMGAKYILLKLGEVAGKSAHLLGPLHSEAEGDHSAMMDTPRLPTSNTHGAGCILSAAITARLTFFEGTPQEVAEYGITKAYEAIYINTKLGHGIHPAETRVIHRD